MEREQYDACWEHSLKDCGKCLLIECPYNITDTVPLEDTEEE